MLVTSKIYLLFYSLYCLSQYYYIFTNFLLFINFKNSFLPLSFSLLKLSAYVRCLIYLLDFYPFYKNICT